MSKDDSRSIWPPPLNHHIVSCVGFASMRPARSGVLIESLLRTMSRYFGDCTTHVSYIVHDQPGDGQEIPGASGVDWKSPKDSKEKSVERWLARSRRRLRSMYRLECRVMRKGGAKWGRPVRWALYYHDRKSVYKFRSDARISVHVDASEYERERRRSGNQLVNDLTGIFSQHPEIHQGFFESAHRVDSWDGDFYSAAPRWPKSLSKMREEWEWQRAGNITRQYVRADTWGIYIGPGLAAKADPKRDLLERFNDRFFPSGKKEQDGMRHESGALSLYCSESPVDQLGHNFISSGILLENLTWIRDQLRETDTLWHLGHSRHDPMNRNEPYDIQNFIEEAQTRLRCKTKLKPGMRQALEAAGFHVPADHPEYPVESMKPKPKKRTKRASSPKSPAKKKAGRKT